MKPFVLSPAEQKRLERLARDAGCTPKSMMRFVLRDGFDFCEWEVRECLRAEAGARRHGAIPNEAVKRDARMVIAAAHARRQKQAA
ncbi:MAG: hypothetical protein AB7O31_07855 [Burkholderiales bacterium]